MAKATKILIVDDEPDIVEFLQYNLEKSGFDTVSALNGKDAIKIAIEQVPDLILLDIMMPVMDGFEFLTNLRLRADAADVPVLVLTAKDLTAEDHERLEIGAQRVLQKSEFNRPQLLAQVRALIGRGSPRADT